MLGDFGVFSFLRSWKLTRFVTTCINATSFKIWTFSAFLYISETTRTNFFKSLHLIFTMYVIMSETFIKIDSLQHLCHTVDLDVSGLAASNDRKEVSQFIVEHFAHFNIHAVQFVGTVAKVTFAVEASKQQVICHQSINTNGVHCAVRGRGVVFARRMFLLTITPWRVTRSPSAENW